MASTIREIGNSIAEKSVERRAPEERGPSLLMLVVVRTHVLRVRLAYFRPHRNHRRLNALDDRGEAPRSRPPRRHPPRFPPVRPGQGPAGKRPTIAATER